MCLLLVSWLVNEESLKACVPTTRMCCRYIGKSSSIRRVAWKGGGWQIFTSVAENTSFCQGFLWFFEICPPHSFENPGYAAGTHIFKISAQSRGIVRNGAPGKSKPICEVMQEFNPNFSRHITAQCTPEKIKMWKNFPQCIFHELELLKRGDERWD